MHIYGALKSVAKLAPELDVASHMSSKNLAQPTKIRFCLQIIVGTYKQDKILPLLFLRFKNSHLQVAEST